MTSKRADEEEFLTMIAEQVASCVDDAVDRWMAEFDSVLQDPHLNTVGRLQAMSAIVTRYRHLRGSSEPADYSAEHRAGCGFC